MCMDYEAFRVTYTPGQPYVGATLTLHPPEGTDRTGAFIAWDGAKGRIAWSIPEPFSVWSGALATAGNVVFYGTLEGYLKAVDARDGHELYRFKTPSGSSATSPPTCMAGSNTWRCSPESAVGRDRAGGRADRPGRRLGGGRGLRALSQYTAPGGQLTVFELPE